jgi:hypothetical protein
MYLAKGSSRSPVSYGASHANSPAAINPDFFAVLMGVPTLDPFRVERMRVADA